MFHGTLVALVTPFREGRVDWPALDRLVDRMVAARLEGLVPCGTTGESPALSDEEHTQLVAAVVSRAAGRTKVIAGTGTNCTEKTITLSKRALDAGADGLMLVSPYYNKPTQEGLFRHFAAVAAACPKPLMLYNIPGRTGVEISTATLIRLRRECANIVAVKHATGSVNGITDLRLACDLAILSGDDPLTLAMMSLGAVGVVSVLANLLPAETKAMVDAAARGDFAEARRLHEGLHPLGTALLGLETNPIPIKTALALRGEMAEEFRGPMCTMSAEKRAMLDARMKEYFGT